MSKGLTGALLILSLLASAHLAHANNCDSTHGNPGETKVPVSYAERMIEARIKAINSVEKLTKFFEEIGEIGHVNRKDTVKMAELIYKDLGQQGVERIVRSLLLTHRHLAREAVIQAFLTYARGEASSARGLEIYFPNPIAKQTFIKWTQLGEQITENSQFMGHLDLAIQDSIKFDLVYGKYINGEQTLVNIVGGLKQLSNPSLVGRFAELFGEADRLTRQFLFDKIREPQVLQNQTVNVLLRGTSSGKRDAAAKTLDEVLEKDLNQLQEEAYFEYRTSGNPLRPQLPDNDATKAVALRFTERREFNLLELNVEYASQILAKHPSADQAVDAALLKLLDTGAKMPDWRHQYGDVTYAELELLILGRNLRGLSKTNIDLKYGTRVLAEKTDNRLYLLKLVLFHSTFDLRKVPALEEIATTYFRRFPENLNEFLNSYPAEVGKFKTDFGI